MVPGVVGSSPISHPRQSRGSGSPRSPISFHIGASPSGKARDFDSLIRWFESSRPSQIIRAGQRRFIKDHDPVAQSAEQLPFKQWVRGSNPRRVTTSSRTAYRSRRLFYKKSSLTHSVAPPYSKKLRALLIVRGAFLRITYSYNRPAVSLPNRAFFGDIIRIQRFLKNDKSVVKILCG